VSIRIPLARRVFAPSWGFTILTVVLCTAFFYLGRWQWHRGELRQAEWDRFAIGAEQVLPVGARALQDIPRFQRVELEGRLDPDHQFLLDNRTYQGHAGFEVLTPLQRPDGRVALVDRGWVPFSGLRDRLTGVALKIQGVVVITGRIAELPAAGLASGRAAPDTLAPWPKVTAYPTMAQLSTALGSPLESRILWLDPNAPDGYVRDWHPPGLEPMRHWSYAAQWWCFAVVLVVIWVVTSSQKLPYEGGGQ
jgi:cytochrome oxidase assembly protein ShyY1